MGELPTSKYFAIEQQDIGLIILANIKQGHKVAELVCDDDGYYKLWCDGGAGLWPSYLLQEIARLLDEINKPWDDDIHEHFEREQSGEQAGQHAERRGDGELPDPEQRD